MDHLSSTAALLAAASGEASPQYGEPDVALRRLLGMACDWTWTLDSQWRLVALEGRRFDRGPDPMLAELNKPPWEWRGLQVGSGACSLLRHTLQRHQRFQHLEYTPRDHRGQVTRMALSGEPVFDAAAKFIGYRGVTHHLTHDDRAESLLVLEHAITRCVADAASSRRMLHAVSRLVCEAENWETGGYFRAEGDQGATRLIAGWSSPRMAEAASDFFKSDAIIPPGGMLSEVIATGETRWDTQWAEPAGPWGAHPERVGERTALFCPVFANGEVLGVLGFTHREQRDPDTRLLRTLRMIGEQVGQFLKRKEAEQVLRESEGRFRALTELSSDWYWELDAKLCIVRVEGRPGEDDRINKNTIGRRPWEVGLDIDSPGGWDAHRAQLAAELPFRDVDTKFMHKDGAPRYISVSGEPIRDHRGQFTGYRVVGRDITDRKLADTRIQHLGTHDGLTGLPNRALFGELLALALKSAERYELKFAVLFLDLDKFKVINDTLGHDAGDKLLQEMASRLTTSVRTSDVVARLGGDEFVVMLQRVEGGDEAAMIARKLLGAIGRPVQLNGREFVVTASIGISIYGADAKDEQQLMQNADVAMYAAKHGGRNGVALYSSEIAEQSGKRLTLESHLSGALERNEFFLHYQPKVDLASGAIVGAEALIRWQSPDLGLVSPMQFIPLAEENGLILPIGKWVLQQACLQAREWRRQGLPALTMAVNLSARQFADEFLLADVAVALAETGMPPECLELEVTEGMVIHDIEGTIKLLKALKQMGVCLSIDDFGTGYSSLGQLKNLPIDTLKIDRSFIKDLPGKDEDRAITQAIIAMGKALKLSIVAEGVETADQAGFLREQGCDQMQGYFFSKPVGAEAFVSLWRRQESGDIGS